MQQTYFDNLRITFSVLVLSSLYRDIHHKQLTAEQALTRLENWNLKFGTGVGIPVEIGTVPHLVALVGYLKDTTTMPSPELGNELHGTHYTLMHQYIYFVTTLASHKKECSEWITIESGKANDKQIRQYKAKLAASLTKYWQEILGQKLPPSNVILRVGTTLFNAAIELIHTDFMDNKTVLVGMAE
jgi:hypothetical protein